VRRQAAPTLVPRALPSHKARPSHARATPPSCAAPGRSWWQRPRPCWQRQRRPSPPWSR
jgi:hypothetical protein